MPNLIVVNNPEDWPLHIPEVSVVAARSYLTDPVFNALRGVRVFNLCRSYSYQKLGYYVSLLAEARNHRPQPDVTSILDLKTPGTLRVLAEDLEDRIQRDLRPLQSNEFELSLYFGRNLAGRYDRLSKSLFDLFQAPLMRAWFVKEEDVWRLKTVRAISTSDVPDNHKTFVLEAAHYYFARRRRTVSPQNKPRFHLAILIDPKAEDKPSNDRALKKFQKAAQRIGFGVEMITKEDFGRIGVFDALFIRVTTAVNHYSYRFSRRAEAEGLVVIDDPLSISRCMNKVYLAQRLAHHGVPTPRTLIIHKDNRDVVSAALGFPCVLKEPDSAFSHGVCKIETAAQLDEQLQKLLSKSDLVIAQEFTPTDYDWRICVLDGKPLFACRYHMAPSHWQVIHNRPGQEVNYGKVDAIPLDQAPSHVVKTATRAANLMGSGLYGVDLKEIGRRCVVIEVNDNPNIDAGYDDVLLKDSLYDRVMETFMERVRILKGATNNGNSGDEKGESQ